MNIDPVLQLGGLRFGYDPAQEIINIESFSIGAGESVFLQGPSGCGKSTLLGLIGGVLPVDTGAISICGQDITQVSAAQRDQLRADHIGIIFQQFNLLPYLNVIQNCTLPCRFSSLRKQRAEQASGSVSEAARELIVGLGLSEAQLKLNVSDLSVGQQQRVAVARALIGGPDLIIADEPTSSLDHNNRDRFIDLLNSQRARFNNSLLFVSHDNSLAPHFDRQMSLPDLNKREVEI